MEPPEKTKTSPTTLKDGDVILSNPQDICDSFNEFFAQIGNTIADYLPDFRNETSDVLEYLHINVNFKIWYSRGVYKFCERRA